MTDIPHVLGNRYEVGDLIGRGGMAEVRLGYDTRLSRSVAIKILRADLARDPMFLARFRREAQSAAALNHPSIVSVYDTGEEQISSESGATLSLPYIVMEYVKGHTVSSLLNDGDPVPISEAAQIVSGVLSALEYSHREGIIHRDIKPGNVMITEDGKVKVMDFGIARAIADSAATMTQTNSVVGTAQYLSPEQARGEVVDARSDLYSTGCLLYELLTGKPPFTGDSAVAVAYQHVSETPVPTSSIAPDIPDALDRVVMKSLAKRREDRYQNASDFRNELLAATRGEGVEAPAVSSWATQVVTPTFAPTQQISQTSYGQATGEYAAQFPPTGMTAAVNEGAKEPKKKRGWLIAVLLVALLAILGAGAWAFTSGNLSFPNPKESTPEMVKVPDLRNMDESQVRNLLESVGLKFRADTDEPSNTIAEGLFVSSNPAPGDMVAKGETVVVHFSSGASSVAVPDLAGRTTEEAAQLLENAGLSLGGTNYVDDTSQKKDRIVSQEPAAGEKVAPKSRIKVNVASGFAIMPDVVGKTQEEAIAELNAAGITHVVIDEAQSSSQYPAGSIISQSSPANTRLETEAIVYLVPAATPQDSGDATSSPSATKQDDSTNN
ncbi:MAG: Stk1 family PASTA domain-containing Ser/Thr kinase [Actinomycetaceae bacterium]|nr:Stk1 family PASTA domain-containing Ser/Thr kinase [Actinomycetaceae bacterium]